MVGIPYLYAEAGPPYSIMTRSPLLIIFGKVNVYSANVVSDEIEFTVSVNVAVTESSDYQGWWEYETVFPNSYEKIESFNY